MPIPKPNKNETQKDFVKRCVNNNVMITEYPDVKQRYSICLIKFDKK